MECQHGPTTQWESMDQWIWFCQKHDLIGPVHKAWQDWARLTHVSRNQAIKKGLMVQQGVTVSLTKKLRFQKALSVIKTQSFLYCFPLILFFFHSKKEKDEYVNSKLSAYSETESDYSSSSKQVGHGAHLSLPEKLKTLEWRQ